MGILNLLWMDGELVVIYADGRVVNLGRPVQDTLTQQTADGLTFHSNGDGTCRVTGINSHTGYEIIIPSVSPAGDQVTGIGRYAFEDRSGLTSITIPESVTSIKDSAFEGCCNLMEVYYQGTEEDWEGIRLGTGNESLLNATMHFGYSVGLAFQSYNNGTCSVEGIGSCTDRNIRIPPVSPEGYRVTWIQNDAFRGCDTITSVVIPESVTGMGGSVFQDCHNLTSVVLPTGLNKIFDGMFLGCWRLASITIPTGVKYIGDYAFMNCESLTSISLPKGVTEISSSLFFGCRNLTSVTIHGMVSHIQFNAFRECTSLKSISNPVTYTTIDFSAFSDCENLMYIFLSKDLRAIDNSVFYNCKNLRDVYYGGTREEWSKVRIYPGNEPLLKATIHCVDGDISPT